MKTWSASTLSNYFHHEEICGPRKEQHEDLVVRMVVLLLVSSLCCPLHAQDKNDYISSETNITTIDTKVVIGAPYAVVSKSTDVFSTGIPIRPVYIQAPSGLYVWLSIQCRGGAAVLSVPEYVAKISLVQTDYTGVWIPSAGSQNATSGLWLVTGLGIKLNQNVSVANDALATLAYIKDADNDIAGKATMTITLNWNVTIAEKIDSFIMKRSKRIIVWTSTALTSVSTFRATVAAVCLVGIFALCCLGCLNTVAIASLRRCSVSLAMESKDQQECEQNRVYNPLWMPCAPSQPEYYNIESSPNPMMLLQRRSELNRKILRMSTPFSLMDRLSRVRHLKSSQYAWIRCRCPCAVTPPLRDSSSDDGKPAILQYASKLLEPCCTSHPLAARVDASQFLEIGQSAMNATVSSGSQLRADNTHNLTQLVPSIPQQSGSSYRWDQSAETVRNSALKRDLLLGEILVPAETSQYMGLNPDWEQSQAATMNAERYPTAMNYLQQTEIFPGNRYYRITQDAGAPGSGR